jgi:hypothetical protein
LHKVIFVDNVGKPVKDGRLHHNMQSNAMFQTVTNELCWMSLERKLCLIAM